MNRTLSTLPLRKLLTGLALSGLVLLSACGGGDEPTGGEPADGGQPSASAGAPSSDSAPSEAPSSEAAPEDSGSDEDKPSKDDVVAGLAEFYEKEQNLSKDKAKKFAECMMDQMYDKASAKSLNAMKDGEPTKMDPDDAELLVTAGSKCASVIS